MKKIEHYDQYVGKSETELEGTSKKIYIFKY